MPRSTHSAFPSVAQPYWMVSPAFRQDGGERFCRSSSQRVWRLGRSQGGEVGHQGVPQVQNFQAAVDADPPASSAGCRRGSAPAGHAHPARAERSVMGSRRVEGLDGLAVQMTVKVVVTVQEEPQPSSRRASS